MAEEAEAMSAAVEELEATAAEETKTVAAAANQEEALAAKVPRRRGDGGHVSPARLSRRRPRSGGSETA